MSKRERLPVYPFIWIDEVIEVTLNPNLTPVDTLPSKVLTDVTERFPVETRQIFQSLKAQCLWLLSDDKTRLIVEHYDHAITELARQAKNSLIAGAGNELWTNTSQLVLTELEVLSHNIRQRYRKYLPKTTEKPTREHDEPNNLQRLLFKVLLGISIDQAGIILKSAYNVKVIVGDSYRKVCSAVAPYLSTERFDRITDAGLRTASIRQEDRDKVIAVEILKKIIEDIQGR